MRVLIVISLFAASGLVWASLSMAQHVRRTRREGLELTEVEHRGGLPVPEASAPEGQVGQGRREAGAVSGQVPPPPPPVEKAAAPPMPPPPQPRSMVQAWATMRRQEMDEDVAAEQRPPAEPASSLLEQRRPAGTPAKLDV